MGERVTVVECDPRWPAIFEALRDRVAKLVADISHTIEHVGSTAVPGLAAKPIIDIDIVVRAPDVERAIERLSLGGYRHVGDLGIQGREAFEVPIGAELHHLYVCIEGGRALTNHLCLRDHLRSHPEDAERYARLKHRLAREFPHDIDGYVSGKTAFILGVLRRYGLPPDDLRIIEQANERPQR